MNPSTFFLSILFTLSLIFISHVPLPASTLTFKLYQIVCVQVSVQVKPDVQGCLKALEADPRIPLAKTYVELSSLIIELAIKNSTGGQNYLKNLMKKDPSPAIKQCALEDYEAVIKGFKIALASVIPDPRTARREIMSEVGFALSRCAGAINNDPKPYFEVNELINRSEFLIDIADISISHLIDL